MRTVTLKCQCCNHVWSMTGAAIVGTPLESCRVGEYSLPWLLCQRDAVTTEGGCGMTMAKVIAVED